MNIALRHRPTVLALVCAALMFGSVPAMSQDARQLSNRIEMLERELRRMQNQAPAMAGRPLAPGGVVAGPDVSDLQVRILGLEQLVQQLTGQLEESNFQLRQATSQLQQLSDDMNYRMAAAEQKLGGGPPPAPPSPTASAPTRPVGAPLPQGTASMDRDAPLSQPVSPQPRMSSTPPPGTEPAIVQAPIAAPPGPPVNSSGGFVLRTDAGGQPLPPDPNLPPAPVAEATPPPPVPAPRAAPNPGAVSSGQLALAPGAADIAMPAGPPKQQYDYAFELLRRNDYARAEAALREFLKRNPKDPLAGNAQYWLGETYYVRGDYQQAAVEFMAGYQNHPKSAKSPDSLLKLGMAMSNLGQTQGACTALGRINREYPDAPDQIRRTAQSERTRLKCT